MDWLPLQVSALDGSSCPGPCRGPGHGGSSFRGGRQQERALTTDGIETRNSCENNTAGWREEVMGGGGGPGGGPPGGGIGVRRWGGPRRPVKVQTRGSGQKKWPRRRPQVHRTESRPVGPAPSARGQRVGGSLHGDTRGREGSPSTWLMQPPQRRLPPSSTVASIPALTCSTSS